MNDNSARVAFGLSVASAVACFAGIAAAFLASATVAGQLFVVTLGLIALRMQFSSQWNTFAFTFWVLAFVVQAFNRPAIFQDWPIGPAKDFISPLIQIIMFCMGTTLRLSDFTRVLKVPKSVIVGMVLQFSVMPLTGWALAKLFGFPAEIAAGVVLIGSCPGGVASNVIAYLARQCRTFGNHDRLFDVDVADYDTACYGTSRGQCRRSGIQQDDVVHFGDHDCSDRDRPRGKLLVQVAARPLDGQNLFDPCDASDLYRDWYHRCPSRDDLFKVGPLLVIVAILRQCDRLCPWLLRCNCL